MGQAFWTGVRLPSSPPASDRIAAMRFFFIGLKSGHDGNFSVTDQIYLMIYKLTEYIYIYIIDVKILWCLV